MERDGIHIKALDTRPTPDSWINFIFNCFASLNRRRINDVIPLSEVKALAEMYEIEDTHEFLFFIDTLDSARSDYLKEKSKHGKHS